MTSLREQAIAAFQDGQKCAKAEYDAFINRERIAAEAELIVGMKKFGVVVNASNIVMRSVLGVSLPSITVDGVNFFGRSWPKGVAVVAKCSRCGKEWLSLIAPRDADTAYALAALGKVLIAPECSESCADTVT